MLGHMRHAPRGQGGQQGADPCEVQRYGQQLAGLVHGLAPGLGHKQQGLDVEVDASGGHQRVEHPVLHIGAFDKAGGKRQMIGGQGHMHRLNSQTHSYLVSNQELRQAVHHKLMAVKRTPEGFQKLLLKNKTRTQGNQYPTEHVVKRKQGRRRQTGTCVVKVQQAMGSGAPLARTDSANTGMYCTSGSSLMELQELWWVLWVHFHQPAHSHSQKKIQ